MINLATQEDIADVNAKLEAICNYFNIKLLPTEEPYSPIQYNVTTHWPFEGGFPREPLDTRPTIQKICEKAEQECR